MSERDELANHLADSIFRYTGVTTSSSKSMADELLAEGYRKPQQPRMIESAYEDDGPDSLPPLSVVLSGGKPAIRQYDHTWMDWDGSSWDDRELEYPLTVLHVGEAR